MTLRHMEIFLAVYEYGSMRKAAEALYISQPTISGAIKEIEDEYQIRLFERLNHRLYITSEGEELVSYARHLLSLYREMDNKLKNHSAQTLLRIGATLTVGTCVLPQILGQIEAEEPEVETSVLVENTRSIEERIAKGELDIGFVEGEIHHPDLVTQPIIQDPMIAVRSTPASHALTLSEFCATTPLLMREPGSGTRALLTERLHQESIAYQEKWVCSNTQALIHAAEAGLGGAIISRLLVQEAIAAKCLYEIPLSDCHFTRWFRLVWHKDKYQNHGFRTFCRYCRKLSEPSI